MYTGSVKLSFCTDNASSTDDNPTIIPYRTTYTQRSVSDDYTVIPFVRTEKSSVNPNTRSIHANPTTESVNAALPSTVFDVVGDHRCFPSFLPTTEAWTSGYRRQPYAFATD